MYLSAGIIALTSNLSMFQPYDDALCGVLEDLLLDGLMCEREKLWRLLKTVSHHSQNECRFC